MSKIILEFTHEEVDQVIQDLQRLATVQTMEQIEATVATRFHERIEAMNKQVEELTNPPKKLGKHGRLMGRWSRKYEACIKCRQQDAPHAGKGLCTRCYQNKLHAENAKMAVPLSVRTDGVDTRPKEPREA